MMHPAILFPLLAALGLAVGSPSPADESEGSRPLFHFTPPRNFINDPTGLVFLDGEYHFFYQHNAAGDRWWPHEPEEPRPPFSAGTTCQSPCASRTA